MKRKQEVLVLDSTTIRRYFQISPKNCEAFFFIFSSICKSVKSPASGKENVRFPDSPDFENFPDFLTRRDIRQSPKRREKCLIFFGLKWKILAIVGFYVARRLFGGCEASSSLQLLRPASEFTKQNSCTVAFLFNFVQKNIASVHFGIQFLVDTSET